MIFKPLDHTKKTKKLPEMEAFFGLKDNFIN